MSHGARQGLLAMALLGAVTSLAAQTGDTPANGAAAAPRIEVITNQAHPVSRIDAALAEGYTVIVYDLDLPNALDAELSQSLSADPEVALGQVKARLDALGTAKIQALFAYANLPLRKALQYELDRFPAVVFEEGAAAVLGVTDVSAALQYYQRFRAGARQ